MKTTDRERLALARIEDAARRHGRGLVLSTSFGIHSAAMLHLATRVVPEIDVVWVDTGYLPPETYRFADRLTARLALNLHVVSADVSPARMEALYGRPWETGRLESLEWYDRTRKVEPMRRGLDRLGATGWLAGLRADQTAHRRRLSPVGEQWGRVKYLPILDWSSDDVDRYLEAHDLPLHPLFYQGYETVGDWHTSRPVDASDLDVRDTRFLGLKQECGLHVEPSRPQRLAAAPGPSA